MPIDYSIERDGSLIVVQVKPPITALGIMNHFTKQLQDPTYKALHSTLVDFSGISATDLFINDDTLKKAILFTGLYPYRLTAKKVAFVVSDASILPFINKCKSMCTSVGETVQIFSSRDSAMDWLLEA